MLNKSCSCTVSARLSVVGTEDWLLRVSGNDTKPNITNFFRCFIHCQESVCATFGTGVGSACVVDVGDQKTAVSCVEDGLSQSATRLVMQYGGSDITRCFHWLLARCCFPYRECRLNNRMDALFLQELKETYCHLEQVSLTSFSRVTPS